MSAVLAVIPLSASAQVIPTSQWVSVWSDGSLHNGVPVDAGAIVQAYDPDDVLCGEFTVTITGTFGLMAVYRDDPATTLVDEGADPGDVLAFKINGVVALSLGPDAAIWTGNGETLHIDLQAGPVPVRQSTWGKIKALYSSQ